MTEPAHTPRVSHADYLAAERAAEQKHEYLHGEMVAMAGGTPLHGLLAANVIFFLLTALRKRGCGVYTSDTRVRVMATGLSTYPDVTVVCGEVQYAPDDPDAIINPGLLVKVLSDSSEKYDRGAKFAHYRSLPSLREYILVSQNERLVEVYHREDERRWSYESSQSGERAVLPALGIELAVDEIYERSTVPATASAHRGTTLT